MLACLIDASGVRLLRDRPRPQAAPGETRVALRLAGICSTDLELTRGYMAFEGIPGHEFVGSALEGPLAGRRVVGEINFGCGLCDLCAAGLARHCKQRRVLGIQGADGVFAEEFSLPQANLHPVPDAVDDETAVFAEPVAAACEILEQLAGRLPPSVLVLGDGKMGPLVAQVLAAEGASVTLVGRHIDSLAWLEQRGIALFGEAPGGSSWPLVVDVTGSAEGLRRALALTRPCGTVVLKTTVAEQYGIDLAPVVIDEITLLGSRCGPLEPALERLADGRVMVAPLIDERYPLARVEEALARAAESGVRKVLLGVSD